MTGAAIQPCTRRQAYSKPHHLADDVQQMPALGAGELLPPSSEPEDSAQKHDEPCRCRRVVHVFAVHWGGTWQIRDDAHEGQKQETDDVQNDAPPAERVRTFESRLFACEVCEDASEEGHGVGEVCPY